MYFKYKNQIENFLFSLIFNDEGGAKRKMKIIAHLSLVQFMKQNQTIWVWLIMFSPRPGLFVEDERGTL